MAFVTNHIVEFPQGLQLRGQLRYFTEFPFNPKSSEVSLGTYFRRKHKSKHVDKKVVKIKFWQKLNENRTLRPD